MDTKEFVFKGFKMNGFLALFLHLVVLTGVAVLFNRSYSWLYNRWAVCLEMAYILWGIYAA